MIAAISMMRRLPGIDLTRFRRHWLDVHGPLVCAFPGLRRYVQCHPVASPATNRRALDMGIDGFPILFFDNDADRSRAHGSPEMAACNIDSRQFVGAVSRVIADAETPAPRLGRFAAIALFPETADAATVAARLTDLSALPRLRGLTRCGVLEQGPAPASTVPWLPIRVSPVGLAWFDSLVDLECAVSSEPDAQAALFATEAHWLG